MRRLARLLPTLLKVGFSEVVAYRGELIIWVLTTNMPLVMLALWSAVARDQPLGRFGQAEFGAYFLVTLIVRLLTGSWVVWEMNMEIRKGTLAMRLLRPLHPFVAYAAENLAAVPFRVAICLPIVAVTLQWLGTGQLASDTFIWLIFPLALTGGWGITFSSMLAIGTLGLFWESSASVFMLWLGLFFVFSGYTIPIELFPPALREVASWLPFRFQLSLPVELALARHGRAQALGLLAAQWGYAGFFLLLATAFWRRGLRRYAAFGG